MLVNRHYAGDRDLILALADIFNAELRKVAAAGCRVIQVEEPQHHIGGALGASDKDLEFYTEAVNREIAGVDTEIWLHTCWGNPNQQPLHWERPSYERSLPYLLATDADVLTLECASTNGRDLHLLGKHRTDKKIAIGVVNHSTAAVEPPEFVAGLIRKALEHVPPERLILSTDCGFGREGLARRIAFYKSVSITLGANIVRRELRLPEVAVPALDALIASERHEVAAVVTRPDAPAGRGRRLVASPVAERAAEAGIEVLKPVKPRDPEFLERLREIAPDCCPVVAYGALLPRVALDIPAHGWVNLHFSLLPAWRGTIRARTASS